MKVHSSLHSCIFPSEAIYYDLLVNEVGAVKVNTRNLIDYAFNEKKVVIGIADYVLCIFADGTLWSPGIKD